MARVRIAQLRVCKVFVGLLLALPGAGQISGDMEVAVIDAQQAPVAGSAIQIKNLETGAERTLRSGPSGLARFPLLAAGSYEIRVTAPGMAPFTTRAELRSGSVGAVLARLELASVRQEITVSEGAIQIDSASAQLQTTTEARGVVDLPLSVSVLTLAGNAPGVTPVSARNPFLDLGGYNANGGRGRANNITLDNATATDVSATGASGLGTVPLDAIAEVNLITHNFSAEFGRNASSQFQILTRSGTNDFHGRLFHFLGNSAMNARDYFDRSGRAAPVRNNRWGAVIGGPAKKNKLFFLGTYEEQKIRGEGGTRLATVPSVSQTARTIDPAARALLDQLQVPITASGTLGNTSPLLTNSRAFSGRADYNLSARDVLYVRVGMQNLEQQSPGLTFLTSNLAGNGAASRNQPVNATISHTRTIGAPAVNQLLASFGRATPAFRPLASTGGPAVTFLDGTDTFGVASNIPQGRTQNTYQVLDTFTYSRGSHSFKAGAETNRIQVNGFLESNLRGTFQFASLAAFLDGRPARYAQRFGLPVRGNRLWNHFAFVQDDWRLTRSLTLSFGLRFEYAGGVSEVNNLIANINLNRQAALGAAGAGPLGAIDTGGAASRANRNWAPRVGFAWNPGRGKLAVRGGYGIAYDFIYLNPITNLGYAPPLMYNLSTTDFSGNNSLARIVQGTSDFQRDARAVVGGFGNTLRNLGSFTAVSQDLKNPQTQQWSLTVEREMRQGLAARASYVGSKTNFLQRSRPLNYLRPGLFTAPRTAAEEDALRLSGAATALNAGLNAAPQLQTNRIDPRFTSVTLIESSANSNYHSMQLYAAKRFSEFYSMTAAYTWSKSIDDVSDALGVLANDTQHQQNPFNNRDNRAASAFDVGQRFVLTHTFAPGWFQRSGSIWLRQALGGWQWSGIFQTQSGQPFNLLAGARAGFGGVADPLLLGGNGAQRPNVDGVLNLAFRPNPGSGARNPNLVLNSGLAQPLLGNFGGLGRNAARTNGLTQFDWTAAKDFPITERVRAQFQAQVYNVFNNTSFSRPGQLLSGPATFGYYSDTDTNARNLLLALRLIW